MHWKWWTAVELSEAEFEEPFLLEPIIPKGGIVLFHGKRGIGKTQLALTLALACSNESILFGRYKSYPGKVVLVEADMVESILHSRLKVIREHGYNIEGIDILYSSYIDVMQLREGSRLVGELQSRNPVLVIWDTLTRVFYGDTNVDSSVSAVYGRLRSILPEATHLIVHHEKKTTPDNDKLEIDELYRGSSAWVDAADTGLRMVHVGGSNRVLQFTKTRTCGPQQSIRLHLGEDLLLYAPFDSTFVDDLLKRGLGSLFKHSFVGGRKVLEIYMARKNAERR